MLTNNVILVLSLAVVLWGTMAPIGYEVLTGDRISIGVPFFNTFFVPLMLTLAAALALVPALNWKRSGWSSVKTEIIHALPGALVVSALLWFLTDPQSLTVLVALSLAGLDRADSPAGFVARDREERAPFPWPTGA